MLTTVRQKPWQKTQLWGLYKTQDGSVHGRKLKVMGKKPKRGIVGDPRRLGGESGECSVHIPKVSPQFFYYLHNRILSP